MSVIRECMTDCFHTESLHQAATPSHWTRRLLKRQLLGTNLLDRMTKSSQRTYLEQVISLQRPYIVKSSNESQLCPVSLFLFADFNLRKL
ncbi:hypothetical protein D3C77_477080 [compost metagenome]